MSRLARALGEHPLLASWLFLALGMVAMLMVATRDEGLLAGQLLALVVATILLAGACVWIISWD